MLIWNEDNQREKERERATSLATNWTDSYVHIDINTSYGGCRCTHAAVATSIFLFIWWIWAERQRRHLLKAHANSLKLKCRRFPRRTTTTTTRKRTLTSKVCAVSVHPTEFYFHFMHLQQLAKEMEEEWRRGREKFIRHKVMNKTSSRFVNDFRIVQCTFGR